MINCEINQLSEESIVAALIYSPQKLILISLVISAANFIEIKLVTSDTNEQYCCILQYFTKQIK